VAAVAGHLAALPAGAQPPLARQLVPLIAKLPFAAERAGAFAKVRIHQIQISYVRRSVCFSRVCTQHVNCSPGAFRPLDLPAATSASLNGCEPRVIQLAT
jgi:hypothetical protein